MLHWNEETNTVLIHSQLKKFRVDLKEGTTLKCICEMNKAIVMEIG